MRNQQCCANCKYWGFQLDLSYQKWNYTVTLELLQSNLDLLWEVGIPGVVWNPLVQTAAQICQCLLAFQSVMAAAADTNQLDVYKQAEAKGNIAAVGEAHREDKV